MRTLGVWVLLGSIIFLIIALSMDTSVSTGYGRVNNLGLMQERQNYIIMSCFGIAIGAAMAIFAGSGAKGEEAPDPFDEIAKRERGKSAQAINERKQYAVKLGVRRENGNYVALGQTYDDFEDAIAALEENKRARHQRAKELGVERRGFGWAYGENKFLTFEEALAVAEDAARS